MILSNMFDIKYVLTSWAATAGRSHNRKWWCVGLQRAAKFFCSSHCNLCSLGSIAIEEQTDPEALLSSKSFGLKIQYLQINRTMQPSQKNINIYNLFYMLVFNQLPSIAFRPWQVRSQVAPFAALPKGSEKESRAQRSSERSWWKTSPATQSAESSGSNSWIFDNLFQSENHKKLNVRSTSKSETVSRIWPIDPSQAEQWRLKTPIIYTF